MLQVRENEISLRRWSGGSAVAHLRGNTGQCCCVSGKRTLVRIWLRRVYVRGC